MTKVRVRSDRRTQRNSSWPGDSALHPKAEYICADLSIGLRFPLAVARRIIHFGEEQISHVRAYYRGADISVLILCEAHKPHRRQFRINYELILSEILFLTADRRGSLVRNTGYPDIGLQKRFCPSSRPSDRE
jgi:hypothetical protein